MADPATALGIAANVFQVVSGAGNILKTINTITHDLKDARANIEDHYRIIEGLQKILRKIESDFKNRPQELYFEKDHHGDIGDIIERCRDVLDELQKELPSVKKKRRRLPHLKSSKAVQDPLLALRMYVNSDVVKRLQTRIDLYTRELQISMEARTIVEMWDMRKEFSKKLCGLEELLRDSLMAAVESPGQAHLPSEDDTREHVYEHAHRVNEVMEAVALKDRDTETDVEASSREPSSTATGGDFSDDVTLDSDDIANTEVLEYEYRANQRAVKRLEDCKIYYNAATYQRRGVEIRKELAKHNALDFDFSEEVTMTEILADLLQNCKTPKTSKESIDLLQSLIEREQQQPSDKRDDARIYRFYHRIGKQWLLFGKAQTAQQYLTRAFNGRLKLEPQDEDDIWESGHYLYWAHQGAKDYSKADGLNELLQAKFGAERGNLRGQPTDAVKWANARRFNIDPLSKDPRFNVVNDDGTSPLHEACRDNTSSFEVLDQMVKYSDGLDIPDQKGETPIVVAAGASHADAVRVLVDNGANLNVHDKSDATPLHRCQDAAVAGILLATKSRSRRFSKLSSVSSGSGNTGASKDRHPSIVDDTFVLQPSTLDINARDMHEGTALYNACKEGNTDMVTLLLRFRADPNIPGPDDHTCLMAAISGAGAQRDKVQMVEDLISAKADPHAQDANHEDAFDAAAVAGMIKDELIEILEDQDDRRSRRGSCLGEEASSDEESESGANSTPSTSVQDSPSSLRAADSPSSPIDRMSKGGG